MKDGIVLETEYTSMESYLTLIDVSVENTGTYVCRANNDYSAIVSPAATVLVKGYYVLISYLKSFDIFFKSFIKLNFLDYVP